MELNTTPQTDAAEMPLGEPHFDQEATLLSARPVVPLQEIAAEQRSGKRLAFGLAMVISLSLGALGGTLIYKQRGQKQSAAIVDTAVAGADGITEEPLAAATEAGTGTLPESSVKPADIRPATSRPARPEPSKIDVREKKVPDFADDRELRRAERIEARRLRRRSERELLKEARRQNRSDDVLRIREIFEGSRKP